MMFTDIATIKAQAGKGGDGLISFHRTRGNPKGGPDGGDGGNGGSIIVKASHNTNTLTKYRSAKLLRAEEGQAGGGNKRHGKNGEDIILLVPPGTIVRDGEDQIADLVENDQEAVVCAGGSGGFGNTHFKSSIRQAPKMAELGEMGENKELSLELKLVADVGLVGLPNAGKSTLLSMVSAAKPAIASYAFTTLTPNLGVVDVDERSFLMADIPGLIEGAGEGKGLGHKFLRHVKRTKMLLHCISIENEIESTGGKEGGIEEVYNTIRAELETFDDELASKEEIILFTKSDLLEPGEAKKIADKFMKARFGKSSGADKKYFVISVYDVDATKNLSDELVKILG